ncbi:MAG: hypothetical protein ABI408_09040 [Gemmatimonadaceae bacterium]
MKAAVLVCAATIIPALVGCRTRHPTFTYNGWALGISPDSATALTKAQFGKPLVCSVADAEMMECETDRAGAGYLKVSFSAVPRRLDDVFLEFPLDRRASRDSLEKWFTERWGPPIPRAAMEKSLGPLAGIDASKGTLGIWLPEGSVFGMVGIFTPDSTRMLSISFTNRRKQLGFRTRIGAPDSVRR